MNYFKGGFMNKTDEIFTKLIEEDIANEIVIEGAKEDISKLFKGDKIFSKMQSKAKSDENKRPEFIAYALQSKGEGIEKVMKKYKLNWEELAIELIS